MWDLEKRKVRSILSSLCLCIVSQGLTSHLSVITEHSSFFFSGRGSSFLTFCASLCHHFGTSSYLLELVGSDLLLPNNKAEIAMRSHHCQRRRIRRLRRLARYTSGFASHFTVALLLSTSNLLLLQHISASAQTVTTDVDERPNRQSRHAPQRNLQLRFTRCTYAADDPTAQFITRQRSNTRRCAWLSADSQRIEEECSSAEMVARLGVIAITEADFVCPHTCGKCADGDEEEELAVPIDQIEEEKEEEKGISDEDDNVFGEGIGSDLAEALGLENGGNNDGEGEDKDKDQDTDTDTDTDQQSNIGEDEGDNDLGLSDNIVVIEPNSPDEDDEMAADQADDEDEDEEVPAQPITQPYQEIHIPNILDPSGMGLDSSSDTVIGILPRRSRTWQQISLSADVLSPPDPMQIRESPAALERDPFKFTEMPSSMPSASPSGNPTSMPSDAPTGKPSSTPSSGPTNLPTRTPSATPSASPSASPTSSPSESPTPMPTTAEPTAFPTIATPPPTRDPWRGYEPIPSNPPSEYFNYSPYHSRGIKNWNNVKDPPEKKYWKDFDEFISLSLDNNKCSSKSRRQSPIDVNFANARGQCFEYHQIRAKAGEYSIEEDIVEKQILPSKLRFVYPRDYDRKADWATTNDAILGPSADVPKGWGHQLPVTHVDIKVPSEHWMEGKRYIAEYQLFLIQNRGDKQRGAPAVSVLFDLHPQNVRNKRFQILLDAFQSVYDADMAKCRARRRRKRRLGSLLGKQHISSEEDDLDPNRSTWLDEPREEEERFQRGLREAERRAQEIRKFNPWTSDIVRTLWFFGYEGSLTEPPCTEFVEWRILDTPALISRKQYWQLRTILFDHVDQNCKRTSVHYQGSVARPIQPYNGRLVHRCMCRDFLGDRDRAKLGTNRCPWKDRDEWGFDRQQYSLEWYERTHKYEEPKEQPLTDWASF